MIMAEERQQLFLVDGSNYVFRAFFALPPLNNSRGMPTNAIFGFIRMFFKLIKDEHPTRIGVIFDSPKRTFRDDLFADYKANRQETPNDLQVQIPFIYRAIDAFRIKRIVREGVEADDVIATLATQGVKKKIDTVIITADKDFMQVVSPHVRLWDPMRDKSTGLKEVRERFGVEPRTLIDIQALMGDSIDNIKGVPGVGEKTASALIQEFGSLDNLYKNLAKVEESKKIRGAKKVAALLTEHRDSAMLARKLVTIDCEVPLDLGPEDFAWEGVDEKELSELLRELEFTSLLQELTPSQVAIPVRSGEEIEVTEETFFDAIAELERAPRLSIHMSENAIGAAQLKIGGDTKTFRFDTHLIGRTAPLLNAPSPSKEVHDLKTHLSKLARFGIRLAGVDFDTMIAGFLINSGKPEPILADLYHEHLAGLTGGAPSGAEPAIIAALRVAMIPKLERDGLLPLFNDIDLPVAHILAEMEECGIAVDATALRTISKEFGDEATKLERECYDLAGREFNLNSPIQLRDVLFNHLKLTAKGLKKTKSGYSTDVDTLEKLAEVHPMPRKLMEYRSVTKLKSTYSDALGELVDKNGRIHTTFHQALTATGRLSSSDPNLQNIPTRTEDGQRIRRAFVADKGCVLLSADYSQIDLRVLAHLSKDPTLTSAFRSGEDIHIRTAVELLGVTPDKVDANARRIAKVINFGIIYGMGPSRLAGELGIPLGEASSYIRRYFERLEGVRTFIDETLTKARETGFVATMYGRRRYLPELRSPEGGARAQAERIAVNTPIQGTAADLIKVAMIKLAAELKHRGFKARMLLQVHDELLLEVESKALDEVKLIAKGEMERAAELYVPLKADLKWGPNWAQLAT
ncbi:MAG TPA: DNA polymerase I [Candidatus Binataceae bacterium]|nr:DNA polymerase I [Candidatus Binataceae bacterium]